MAGSVPLSAEAIEEVKIAASEAVANIVRHAYNGTSERSPVVVRCSGVCGKLTLEITDRGVGFEVPPVGCAPYTAELREGGLGIFLMRSLMDSVDYWSGPNLGTRIRMTKGRSVKCKV